MRYEAYKSNYSEWDFAMTEFHEVRSIQELIQAAIDLCAYEAGTSNDEKVREHLKSALQHLQIAYELLPKYDET